MVLYMLFAKFSKDNESLGLTMQKGALRITGVFLWEPYSLYKTLYCMLPMMIEITAMTLTGVHTFSTNLDNFEGLIDLVLTLIACFIFISTNVKLFMLHWSRKELRRLFEFLESLPKLDDEYKKKLEGYCVIYSYLMISAAVPKFIYAPIKGDLPYNSYWPFDYKTSTGWWTAYVLEFAILQYVFIIQMLVDTILAMSVLIMRDSLSHLRRMLSKLGENPDEDEGIVKTAVKFHIDLLNGAEMINDCYSIMIMFQILYVITHSVIIIFYLIKSPDILNGISLSNLLVGAYIQLFLYCGCGQLLTNEFEKLSEAIFKNKWYKSTQKVKKALGVMSTMAQRPVLIKNFEVFKALNTTYLNSCQESFSYFIVLRTFSSNYEEIVSNEVEG